MSWTYKHRKNRDTLRKLYTLETGDDDYKSPSFEAWLKGRGEIQ